MIPEICDIKFNSYVTLSECVEEMDQNGNSFPDEHTVPSSAQVQA